MAKSGDIQKLLTKTEKDAVQSKEKAREVREELGDNKSEESDSRKIDKRGKGSKVRDDKE